MERSRVPCVVIPGKGSKARMQNREFDRWARVRGQGMLRYVLFSGLLCFGLPVFLLMTYVIPHPRFTVMESALLWWVMAGVGYGMAMWLVQERRFRKAAGRS